MQNDTLEHLLNKAKEQEKKYEWLRALEFYKKAIVLLSQDRDSPTNADLHAKMGFCCYKAAFQAQSNDQFSEIMKLAIQTYEEAAALFENSNTTNRIINVNDSQAMAAYAKSWLEAEPLKKKIFLGKWWALKSKVLEAYEKVGNHIGIVSTCNAMLEGSLDCRYWLGTNSQESKKIRDELIALGERAISMIPEAGYDYERASAYCWTSLYCLEQNIMTWAFSKEETRKGLEYSKKALEISQKTGDAWLIGWSGFSASRGANIQNDYMSEPIFLNRQIEQGEIAKDNYLLGMGQFWLVVRSFLHSWSDEDPDKNREIHNRNLKTAQEVVRQFEIINMKVWNPYFPPAAAFLTAASIELNPEAKHGLLEKAVEYGRRNAGLTEKWSYANSQPPLNIYSWTLYRLSEFETNVEEKRRLLEELLDNAKRSMKIEKMYPESYYFRANTQNWIALGKSELLKLAIEGENKVGLVDDVVRSIETCIELTKMDLERILPDWVYSRYGDFYYSFGWIYSQLHMLTKEPNFLRRALEIYNDTALTYNKIAFFTGVAKANWQKAKVHEQMGKLLEAMQDYELASEAYLKAAEKIPQLREFYKDHSLYMLAWGQIERARYSHIREDYAQAVQHYREAASLLKKSTPWSYLASNYYAWEQLERGEDLSRKEQPEEAIQSFQLAIEYFEKVKNSISNEIKALLLAEEKEQAARLAKASDLRRRYCHARISLEEAKISERKGEYNQSSQNYEEAAGLLGGIVSELESEEEKRELRLIMSLSQAWAKMTLAEEQASAEVFLEASQLFEQAKTYSPSKKTTMLIVGNSSFCKGLAAGAKYQTSLEPAEHSRAKGYMKNAATNYLQAGFKSASEYAEGTQRLFDAYLFMNQAEIEPDQEERAKQYQMAEKLLQISAGSFMKANQPEKTAQVRKMLKNVREQRTLAVSLNELLHAPTIASTTLSFATPTPTGEVSVGLERFEHANVQANLVAGVKEVKVGESFCLTVEFVNAGKEPALLTRVEDVIPPDFIVVEKPEIYQLEKDCLNMKGKQIAPLKLVEAKLVLQPSKKGVYKLKPRVHYLDELGQKKSLELKSLEIKVEEVILAGRIPTGTEELDSLLMGGIPEGYAVALTGPPNDEREMIIKNFLETGAKGNQVAFYIATEAIGLESLLEKSSFYLFLCNPEPRIKVPDLPNVSRLRSKTDLTNLNIALLKACRNVAQSSSKRVCVEIVSDVLVDYGVKATRKWITELTTELISKGFTLLAVINPLMHKSEELYGILDLFDGEISLYQTEDPLECKKSLRVMKLRNQDYIKNSICLTK